MFVWNLVTPGLTNFKKLSQTSKVCLAKKCIFHLKMHHEKVGKVNIDIVLRCVCMKFGDSRPRRFWKTAKHVLGKKRVFFFKKCRYEKCFTDGVKHHCIVRYVCMAIGQAKVNWFPKEKLKPFWGKTMFSAKKFKLKKLLNLCYINGIYILYPNTYVYVKFDEYGSRILLIAILEKW